MRGVPDAASLGWCNGTSRKEARLERPANQRLATFRANPTESNRIWIAGRPMEEWLHGAVGSSRCCSVCGDSDCRTVEGGGRTFEAIPERLIIRAALIASSEMLDGTDSSLPIAAPTG